MRCAACGAQAARASRSVPVRSGRAGSSSGGKGLIQRAAPGAAAVGADHLQPGLRDTVLGSQSAAGGLVCGNQRAGQAVRL
jgi:hypothetical protein